MLGVEGKLITEIDPKDINQFWEKSYDSGVPSEIEIPEIPLYELLDRTAEKFPDKIAIDFLGKKLKYGELKELSDRVAGFLKSLGVGRGSRVVIDMPNTPHYVIAYYGILKTGATVVQANPLYTERELRHIAENSEARIFFAVENAFSKVYELKKEGIIDRIIVCRIEDYLPFPLNFLYRLKKEKVNIPKDDGIAFWTDVVKSDLISSPEKVDPKEDIAVFQYTGGTTGLPKAAMLTHYNLVANTYQIIHWLPEFSEKDVVSGILPYFHVYGMTTSMNMPIAVGAKIVMLPDPRDIKRILNAIEKHGITLFFGVPTLFNAINTHPDTPKKNLRSIRACISGSAPLPLEVKREFERITGGKLVEGYGLSETSPVTHVNPIYGTNKEGSIGIPIPNTYALVIDEEGKVLPVGEIGELAIFGPQVMKGYYKMEEETRKTLVSGWLLTGDMAKMDEDGYFYIVDRKKDVIIAGGYNIYPREVEEVLYEHPAVLEAAVVGVPDKYRGETVKAFIVLRPEHRGKVSEKDIEQFCRQKLAAYKVPRIIEFVDELPKSAVGKVLRRVLRDQEVKKMEQS
ncbi:long-chain-fatty-acid--CoA ligase [Geoglobus acetivorans]|uniref:Long-chain-fatty-acid--CoA ligase n=1 Tax=Geoglobus acetivorans TaxID=565033 RepID=A0A0A7GES6_GEOAI|nr:Long-chain-fatty-acid--CoA ligase [Geoglobus acetivorans]